MRQAEIVTEKVEMLVVDLPTDGTFNDKIKELCENLLTVFGTQYKHLGKETELTEEYWKGIVENHEYPFEEGSFCYPDYEVYPKIAWKAFNTATESGLSLLKANGVVLDNPYDEPGLMPSAELDAYRQAESKVWKNPHIFIKKNRYEY